MLLVLQKKNILFLFKVYLPHPKKKPFMVTETPTSDTIMHADNIKSNIRRINYTQLIQNLPNQCLLVIICC